MKVRALVLASQGKLRDCGIENPARDARLMLANCLGVEVHRLNLLDDSFPSEDELSKFWIMVDERCKRKPRLTRTKKKNRWSVPNRCMCIYICMYVFFGCFFV